jgi:hypothetical protein
MTEVIFNLYVYSNLDIISEVGVVRHIIDGNDEEKITFLKQQVDKDFAVAEKFELPDGFQIKKNGLVRKGIDFTSYRDLSNQGYSLLIFQNAFQYYNSPANPLVVITPVKDGKIYIEGVEDIKSPPDGSLSHIVIEKQKEWYDGYIDEKGFHFAELINDDFIEAVRILHNANHYVSAMKLLMICVDTVAYLEYGDIQKNFHSWLSTYVSLSALGITEEELWEFRNSILHMTNLDSRKVETKKIKRLMFYTAHPSTNYVTETDEGRYFKFMDLLKDLADGIGKWGDSYNAEKSKFEIFLKRYDRIISDKRMTYIYYNKKSPS